MSIAVLPPNEKPFFILFFCLIQSNARLCEEDQPENGYHGLVDVQPKYTGKRVMRKALKHYEAKK